MNEAREELGRTNAICETESASSLNTPSDILNHGSRSLGEAGFRIHARKVAACEDLEARRNLLAGELRDRRNAAVLGNLDLELALSESKRKCFGDESRQVRLGDHVLPRDSEIDVALSHEARDVGRWEEDPISSSRISRIRWASIKKVVAQRHVVVPHEADVEPV